MNFRSLTEGEEANLEASAVAPSEEKSNRESEATDNQPQAQPQNKDRAGRLNLNRRLSERQSKGGAAGEGGQQRPRQRG